ncbi:MAG: GNAT family N-acetyltransferase [Nitrospiraceae bacterium]
MSIRLAETSNFDRIWEIFQAVVETGDTYAYDPAITKEQAKETWMGRDVRTYVALIGSKIEGTYILKPNQPGLGSHVANAAFMVDPAANGKGIGTQMGQHALTEAKSLGYQAIQFNFVISTNKRAVALWKRLGFSIIGTSPKAYRHAQLGLVDVYIMHRSLE